MLVGSAESDLVMPMAEALRANGVSRAMVVHGEDGLDEITTTGLSAVADVTQDGVTETHISPKAFGLSTVKADALRGGNPATNAAALSTLLDGAKGAYADIVALNAGAALNIAGHASSVTEGIEIARESIASGAAKTILAKLAVFSHG